MPSLSHKLSALAIALVVASCGGDGSGGSGATSGGSTATLGNAVESANFAGYQVTGSVGTFRKVSGTWTVPSVTTSASDTASSAWAGIGGGCINPPDCTLVEPTLIQAGTEHDSTGGQPSYFAWWEALPAPAVQASGGPLGADTFDVAPGDRITVDIDGSNLVLWAIRITNVRGGSTHWTFDTTVPYVVGGTTAEWIVESPLAFGVGGVGQPDIANFGRVPFSALTANGANPHLGGTAFVLTDADGNVLATPSVPSASGDAFAVCFGSGPCS